MALNAAIERLSLAAAPNFEDILSAAARIRGRVLETPCLHSRTLSRILGPAVHLKFENLQFTASFKERGALNKLLTIRATDRDRGVIAASAGNHAQGVAYHAASLSVPATIVMPVGTPTIKVERVRDFGARIVLRGANFAEASAQADDLSEREGLIPVHPFDDPQVIAGQGTAAIEMLGTVPEMDTLVLPVGGGGLIAGCAIAAAALRPGLRIVGVQSELFPGMAVACERRSGPVPGGVSVAEGIAVAAPSELTRSISTKLVDEFVVVREEEIEEAVALLLGVEKTLCEGAGAAGLAALIARPDLFRTATVGIVLSGGNIDTRLLVTILQRQLVRSGRIVRLRVNTPDTVGSLGRVSTLIGEHGGNINDVRHERIFAGNAAKSAMVVFEVELRDPNDRIKLVQALGSGGFNVQLDA